MTTPQSMPDTGFEADTSVDELTNNAFKKAFLSNDYLPVIEGVHQGIKRVYDDNKHFQDEYLTPTSTEHILDTHNQPNTANTNRAQTVETLNERKQELYASYDTTPQINHDTINTIATNTVSHEPNPTTKILNRANDVFITGAAATGLYSPTGAFGISTGEYLLATAACTAGLLSTKAAYGVKAAYHANQVSELRHKHQDENYHDNKHIKAAVMKPMIAHAQQRQSNRDAIQSIVNNAITNQKQRTTP
jgi:hypothetical protein